MNSKLMFVQAGSSSENESDEESVNLDWLPDPDKIYGKEKSESDDDDEVESEQNGESEDDK